jgi:hypothetical protein
VRIVPHGHTRHDGQVGRVDNDQAVLRFLKHQQCVRWRFGRLQGSGQDQWQ